ncbi:hypothetical protein LWI28_024744 [Acer negundo]|uniref:Retrotransposon gag domain-containing protein n=1 Tax=Acer negundo TaxID=4023 RepID=A0AAD5IBK1_ACENE|nr:hypothetical protein LWI28_024744 [Acer negundo]
MKVTEQWKKQLSKIAKDLEELKKGKTSEEWDPLKKFYAPFSEEVRKAVLPKNLRMLQEKYSGLTDPRDHLELFYQQMEVQHASKIAMCRLFPMTFDGVARNWFRKLSPGSITSFSQLTKEFVAQFQGAIPPRKDPFVLQYIRQESGETLRDYLERYHAEVIDMGVFNEKETLTNFGRTCARELYGIH